MFIIDWTFQHGHRFADVDVTCICQLLGKMFLVGRHRRLADPSRPWAKTYHGLYGRGSCSQGHRTGQAERQQSSGSLAEGHWQGSERPDIQAFFISPDEEVVRKAIEQDRQSVSKAREAWQKATGKEASDLTFKRFLSALAQDVSE